MARDEDELKDCWASFCLCDLSEALQRKLNSTFLSSVAARVWILLHNSCIRAVKGSVILKLAGARKHWGQSFLYFTHALKTNPSERSDPTDAVSNLCRRDCKPGRWCWFWPRWTPDVKGRTSSAHRCFRSHWSSSGRRSWRVQKAEEKQTKLWYTGLVLPEHEWLFFLGETPWSSFIPHVLIPTADSKVLRLGWVDKDGVQSHLFVPFLDNHQFAAAQMYRGTKGQKTNPGS